MRVIQVLPKFSARVWGGAESSALALSRSLQLGGHAAEIWAGAVFDDEAHEIVADVPVRRFWVVYAPGERRLAGNGKAGLAPGLVARVFALPADALVHVHCHNRLASSVVAACRARRIPTILTLHSRVADLRPGWRYWLPNIWPIKAANVVTAVSERVAADARIVAGREHVEVIPNGVDASWVEQGDRSRGRKRLGVGKAEPLILFVGRVTRIKRLEILMEAVKLYARADHSVRLAVVGPAADQIYMSELQARMAADAMLATRVAFTGAVPYGSEELADFFAAADVVVLASEFEAQPLVVVEAWAAGRAVVVSDVGGMGPMVRRAGVGRLWDPASGPTGLAAELRAAVGESRGDPGLARRARAAAGEFSVSRITARYLALYEQLVSRDGR